MRTVTITNDFTLWYTALTYTSLANLEKGLCFLEFPLLTVKVLDAHEGKS